jgi:hypothetical protein
MKLFELSQAKSRAAALKSKRLHPTLHTLILAILFPLVKLFFEKFSLKNILKKV